MRVAIVGGGASGVLAAHALDGAGAGFDLVLADPRPGRGLAYGGSQPLHLLNTRASNMSIDGRRPDGFIDWLEETRPEGRCWSRDDFAPRRVYGDYLAQELRELAAAGSVRLVEDRVDRMVRSGGEWRLSTRGGGRIAADAVVLATGNPRPRPLAFPGREGLAPAVVMDDPWDEAAVAAIPGSGGVLLVGTGLTAVDVAVSLLRRPAGPSVIAASRRGLLPRIHDLPRPAVARLEPPFPTTAKALYRRVRDDAEALAGDDPYARHALFLGLRPVIPQLWAGLPLVERQRFMRHLRAWWEVERHRLAPSIAAIVAEGEAHGRFEAARGRVAQAEPSKAGARVTLASGGMRRELEVTRIVNCTGPDWGIAHNTDPLLRSVLEAGARADDMGMGLAVDGAAQVLGCEGPIPGLYALGPLTRGTFFEITAVPEIRTCAAALARRMTAGRAGYAGCAGARLSTTGSTESAASASGSSAWGSSKLRRRSR